MPLATTPKISEYPILVCTLLYSDVWYTGRLKMIHQIQYLDNRIEDNITRKPYCRKETARCRSCSFRFKVIRQHSVQV